MKQNPELGLSRVVPIVAPAWLEGNWTLVQSRRGGFKRCDVLRLLARQRFAHRAPTGVVISTRLSLRTWVAEENAALHALLQRSAEFAHLQAEALAAITQMAHALALNEGLAKDRAFLADTLAGFSEECAAAVNARMGVLTTFNTLQRSAATGEGNVRSPWPFMVSVNVHSILFARTGCRISKVEESYG